MAHNKEIGEIFASKLKDAKQSPSKEMWKRVDKSLDKQKKIKNMFYWFLGGSALFIGIFLILNINFSKENPYYIEENLPFENETIVPIVPIDQDKVEKQNEALKVNGISSENENANQNEINFEEKIKDNSQKELNDNLKLKNNKSLKTESIDNTYEVKKNYYYYNSEDGQNIVTENIEIIDSLVNKKQQEIDSLPENKNNLLGL